MTRRSEGLYSPCYSWVIVTRSRDSDTADSRLTRWSWTTVYRTCHSRLPRREADTDSVPWRHHSRQTATYWWRQYSCRLTPDTNTGSLPRTTNLWTITVLSTNSGAYLAPPPVQPTPIFHDDILSFKFFSSSTSKFRHWLTKSFSFWVRRTGPPNGALPHGPQWRTSTPQIL